MKFRIVKIRTAKDHMKHDHSAIRDDYKLGSGETMFYYDKSLALNQAGNLESSGEGLRNFVGNRGS